MPPTCPVPTRAQSSGLVLMTVALRARGAVGAPDPITRDGGVARPAPLLA